MRARALQGTGMYSLRQGVISMAATRFTTNEKRQTKNAASGWIGVISDTHGLIRAEALAALAGAELILHAGDIGGPTVLQQLRRLAPVVAVRGNTDRADWAQSLPVTEVVKYAGRHLYMLHDRSQLDLQPAAAGFAAVISGHSHQPSRETRGGVLYFNPGSAGPRRFTLPVSVGRLRVEDGEVVAEVVVLDV
jgi:putative phosphoesterase